MTKKKTLSFILSVIMIGMLIVSGIGKPQDHAEAAGSQTINNDCFWKDTSGNNIYSQGGGIFKFGDTYYWYGVHYKGAETYAANPSKKNSDTEFVSVTCYSSKDLVNWKFENDVLTPRSQGWNWAYWVGRLGVAYCPKSKQYVLVTQYNESCLFASCSTPTGDFEVKNVQDQIPNVQKQGTGDQTVFVDDDGQAYLICSNKGGRGHQYVAKLRSSDYLAAEPAVEVAKGSGREGNCMFKYKGKYYFCASDLHGWNSSHSYYMVADNIYGPYTKWDVMEGTDEDFSHVTQTGFFYTIKGSKQETVLFCGDRWSDFAGNGLGYNQWVPLTVNGNHVKFNSLSQFELNAETGEWKVGEKNNYILNPTFEADRVSQQTLAGWKASGTGNSNKSGGHTGNWCAQQWSDKAYKATLTQDVLLPNGIYKFCAWVKSTGGQNSALLYIRGAGQDKIVNVNKKIDNWTEITIDGINIDKRNVQVGIYSDANAGNWLMVDDLSLVRTDGEPIQSEIEPSEPVYEPIPDGKLIKSLEVRDQAHRDKWSLINGVDIGSEIFGDRAFKVVEMPDKLKDAEWISTACDSKKFTDTEATFEAGEDITAYVGLDSRIVDTPQWLSDWTETDEVVIDDGNPVVTYRIYEKDFAKDQEVTLGKIANSGVVNYFAAAKELEYIPGDINGDGKVNVFDRILLTRYMRDPSLYTELRTVRALDMNGDGAVNAADFAYIQDFLLGKGKEQVSE